MNSILTPRMKTALWLVFWFLFALLAVDIYFMASHRPIQYWVGMGDEDKVASYLSNGGSFDVRLGSGYTLLMVAVANGRDHVASVLLDHGADVDATNETGDTALQIAVSKRSANLVKLLLSHGAKFDMPNPIYSYTPFETAIRTEDLELIKPFIEHGAKFTTKSLSRMNNPEVIDYLKEHLQVENH